MDEILVTERVSVVHKDITDEDKEIGAEFNRTMRRALVQANLYLTHGPETARLAITKSFLAAASRLSAADVTATLEQHRTAFMTTLGKLTDAAATPSALGRAYDQDE